MKVNAELIANDWNSASFLQTEEDMALYLQACLDEAGDNPAFIQTALENIAKAKDLNQKNQHDIEAIMPSFSSEIIHFTKMLNVLKNLGLKVSIQTA